MPPKKTKKSHNNNNNSNKSSKAVPVKLLPIRVAQEPTELHTAISERDYQKLLQLFLPYEHEVQSGASSHKIYEHPLINTLAKWVC